MKDLFRTKEFHVCNSCLEKYPFEIEYNYFPLDNRVLEVVSLFRRDRNINYDYFMSEYSDIYKTIRELNVEKLLITTNKIYISEEILCEYSRVSTLLDKDIILLTNVLIV